VVLLGPRQLGKTTLARATAAGHPRPMMPDLERESDPAALEQPELFFPAHRDRMRVLDEVQLMPRLFEALRPEIEADRRAGRFLLLGSASGDLLCQSGESLAGRASYLELMLLLAAEPPLVDPAGLQSLWLRGGFPLSTLAPEDNASCTWRQDFVRTFLQRELPRIGVCVPAETLWRFWQMLAHLQGELFNASQLGMSLGGASHTTATRYLDVRVDTMMVRRLRPHLADVGKRLVKSPKV
jgi:predicted AAA+ superfamily ATPase